MGTPLLSLVALTRLSSQGRNPNVKPLLSITYRCLASTFAHLGRDAEARNAAARALHRPQEVLRDPPRPRALDAARQAGARARASAPPSRFGHAYVGTEHLLLGLFPPGGIGATILGGYGLTEETVADQVLARAPRNDTGPSDPPFTPLAAQVLGGALTEAISMGHNYIGTEHLLLGLFGQPEGLAAQILDGRRRHARRGEGQGRADARRLHEAEVAAASRSGSCSPISVRRGWRPST